MSSFRNNRVVVASLFLPSTVVLADKSSPPTPPSHPVSKKPTLNLPPAARSIVDDLLDKTSRIATPAAMTPTTENTNPFARLVRTTTSTLDSVAQAFEPSRNESPRNTTGPRLQSKSSRSSSRFGASRSSTSLPTQSWHFEPNSHCNGGLKNAINSLVDSGKLKTEKVLWVGTLGGNTDDFNDALRKDIDAKMGSRRSLPVWVPDAEFQSCYDEFCHQVLWPSLHYAVPDAPKTKMFYESGSYKQYVAVNQRFADAIIANYKPGDIIWVNDYHLMLLPAMLRSALPQAPIGFFMHVAFPSSEIFRCLSVRQHLLRGILAADLVGFQTASFARHFRQTVSRILAWEALPKGIQVPEEEAVGESLGDKGRGRFVDVGVYPMGIDVRALAEKRREPEVAEWMNVLKQRYAGMKIVVGRDKLDEIQGVQHKIKAFERFLEKYPEFQEKVVLIQVALQTTDSPTTTIVADSVSHINSRFSTLTYQPVVFLHTHDLTSFSQYLALLSVADAFLVTSLREGMALRAHEFVECQEGRHRPLILSEFTGSYSYRGFRSCIAINPWDTRGTADAIHQALTMSDDEALSRWEDLHSHVITQTSQTFVTSFLTRCVRAHTEHMHAHADVEPEDGAALDIPRLVPRYKHSEHRLIVVDLEATLWDRDIERVRRQQLVEGGGGGDGAMEKDVELPAVKSVISLLGRLTKDKRNDVWLLSGLPVKGALEDISKELPGVGIVAENGCFIKSKGQSSWINMCANFNLTWRGPCLEILNYFTERTPGSFVEAREASVVWRFWTGIASSDCADRQWAQRQAAEAQNHIFDSLGERYGLRIIPGQNSFLVLPNNISRAIAIAAVLHPGGPGNSRSNPWMSPLETTPSSNLGGVDLDFVFAASGDERLLRRLNEFDMAETCSTSGKGSDAKWKLDKREVVKVLEQFATVGGN